MPRKARVGDALPHRRKQPLEAVEATLREHLQNRPSSRDLPALTAWVLERERLVLEVALLKPMPEGWKRVEARVCGGAR